MLTNNDRLWIYYSHNRAHILTIKQLRRMAKKRRKHYGNIPF